MTQPPYSLLPAGSKFALIALSLGVHSSVPDLVDLGSGLYATRKLDIRVPDHWKEWLGSILWDELHEAELLLWAVVRSEKPNDLDAESSALQKKIIMFYYGLMLAAPHIITNQRGFLLNGSRTKEVDVRQHGWLPELAHVDGLPWAEVRLSELKEALRLSAALQSTQDKQPYRRLRSAFNAFYAGLQASDPSERIHEFVRAIEGCILPKQGKTKSQFASRTELFVGPSEHQWSDALFDVRSAVEHLNDRLESLALPLRRDAILKVLRLAHESQAVARYCFRRIYSDDTLRMHFRDDEALGAFWALPASTRQKLWGDPLDLSEIRKEFQPAFVNVE